jgi:NAD(P)-dependent dehydrogenase (short-subunit alcohol dehydrogenase family)
MKTAVITGGTRGIGASMVMDFLRNEWSVVYSGTNAGSVAGSLAHLDGKFRKGTYAAFTCDVTKEDEISRLWQNAVDTFGRVDIWVNNAGIGNDQELFFRLPSETIIRIIDTNVKGLMLATRIAYIKMLEQGSGAIYNMQGLGSDGRMIKGLTPYGTSKRAVQYFTEAFRKEIEDSDIIIGSINPGMVLTDLTLSQVRKDPEKNRQLIRIYNILANDPETVTPVLVKKMITNRRNGANIKYYTSWSVFRSFLLAPLSQRDVVSKYLRKE